jgi:hypothetical protein
MLPHFTAQKYGGFWPYIIAKAPGLVLAKKNFRLFMPTYGFEPTDYLGFLV